MRDPHVAVVGAGPAGLALALALGRQGWRVLVVEAHRHRRRHLCGEFLSGDGWQALEDLGLERCLRDAGCPPVHRAGITLPSGLEWQVEVPGLGGGCSRQLLVDTLEAAARDAGVQIQRGLRLRPLRGTTGGAGGMHAVPATEPDLGARLTLWAGGQSGAAAFERAIAEADRAGASWEGASRAGASGTGAAGHGHTGRLTHRRGHWVGVAVHGRPGRPGGETSGVRLHVGAGGYVGVVAIEGGRLNVCGLLPARRFGGGDPLRALDEARICNRFLDNELRDIDLDRTSLVTVGGLDFSGRGCRTPLSVGDARASPAPVLGQGLAAAVCGARILASWAGRHLRGEIDAAGLEAGYQQAWRAEFGPRLRRGRWLHAGLQRPGAAALVLGCLRLMPGLSARLVRSTRGPLPAAGARAAASPSG